jgi:hypothetical protein
MLAIGNYRLVLHPNADPAALESQLAGHDTGFQLQLTRITTSVDHRLLRRTEPGPDHQLSREYVLQVSVQLMASDVRYDFDENLERIQSAVRDRATVLGVDVFAEVIGELPSGGS